VLAAIVSEVFGSGESETRSDDTFDGGIVCLVHEEDGLFHGTVLLEFGTEETGGFLIDTHSSEDDAEIFGFTVLLDETGLTHNLGSDVVVGETSTREERNLLTTRNGGHDIDGGDTSANHFSGIDTSTRIDGDTSDITVLFGDDWRATIDRNTGTVEDTTEHILRDTELHDLASELAARDFGVDTRSTFEDLDDGLGAIDFEDLTAALGAIREFDFDDFGELGEANIFEDNERTVDSADSGVLETRTNSVTSFEFLDVSGKEFILVTHRNISVVMRHLGLCLKKKSSY
jgi:hypothetical protein